jgi:hypothetical protein
LAEIQRQVITALKSDTEPPGSGSPGGPAPNPAG